MSNNILTTKKNDVNIKVEFEAGGFYESCNNIWKQVGY